MSGWENEQTRQMGKAVKEYSDVMSELAEAKEADGQLIMRSPIKELSLWVGIGGLVFDIILMIWGWIDDWTGSPLWFSPMLILPISLIGVAVFYKVVIDSETITKYSIFFGIPKRIRLKKVTRVVVLGSYDKIKLYIGKIRVLTLRKDTAGGCWASIEYFERAGIKVEYKDHSKLYYALRKY